MLFTRLLLDVDDEFWSKSVEKKFFSHIQRVFNVLWMRSNPSIYAAKWITLFHVVIVNDNFLLQTKGVIFLLFIKVVKRVIIGGKKKNWTRPHIFRSE